MKRLETSIAYEINVLYANRCILLESIYTENSNITTELERVVAVARKILTDRNTPAFEDKITVQVTVGDITSEFKYERFLPVAFHQQEILRQSSSSSSDGQL